MVERSKALWIINFSLAKVPEHKFNVKVNHLRQTHAIAFIFSLHFYSRLIKNAAKKYQLSGAVKLKTKKLTYGGGLVSRSI